MAKTLQHQIITRALELIEEEAGWTRAAIARTASGEVCEIIDRAAVRFCAIGALSRAVHELLGDPSSLQVYQVAEFILAASNSPQDSLARINDAYGHAVVVDMFKRALAA
jgi:hypothetical protein